MSPQKYLTALVFLGVLFLSLNVCAQEYYYYNGEKLYVTHQQNRYVVNFDKTMPQTERKDFLVGNEFMFNKNKLLSDYTIIESNKDENKIEETVDFDRIKSVTRLFSTTDNDCEFTTTDKIIVKMHPTISEAQIFALISAYNPEKIERKWSGDRIISFRVNTTEERLYSK